MGFPCVSVKMPKCLTISFLGCFKLMVMPILRLFCLVKQQPHELEPEHYHHPQDNDVLVVDGLSIISIPVQTLTSLIKKRLRVVPYGESCSSDGVFECSVCLECVERSHEVRELVNCCHVFHQGCLDRWVDEGQVTCPLCRSMLFPARSSSFKRHIS